jgi:hypothetical protein
MRGPQIRNDFLGNKMPDEFKQYRSRKYPSFLVEIRPAVPGEALSEISDAAADRDAGPPREGDMVVRLPDNHADQWLIRAADFPAAYEAT